MEGGEGEDQLVRLEQRVYEAVRVRVYVVTMCNGENRFNPNFLRQLLACLDRIEADVARTREVELQQGSGDGSGGWGAAVVTTGGGGQPRDKFYSNGIDLRWVEERRRAGDTAALRDLGKLFGVAAARLISFPLPTFAGACMSCVMTRACA
jgi:enoyl-CoA hydratase/carnithine racemase